MFNFRIGRFAFRFPSFSCRISELPALMLGLALVLSGCASSALREHPAGRPFVFGEDTFAYPNDLVWVYYRDPTTGKWRHRNREPRPDYTHHCFVVARSARQFFQHAKFDPAQPVASEATYRKLIRRVVDVNPRKELAEAEKIVIPGYSNLFLFSRGQEKLLKAECGSAWQSYFQRGHWRMIFPFSKGHQEAMVGQLQQAIRDHRPPILHVVRFPKLSINHAIVLFDSREVGDEIQFSAYDPYDPAKPAQLTFHRKERRFSYPATDYFTGGRVDVYEIYYSWLY